MKVVSFEEAQKTFYALVKSVETTGEIIRIMRDGRLVAKLEPPHHEPGKRPAKPK